MTSEPDWVGLPCGGEKSTWCRLETDERSSSHTPADCPAPKGLDKVLRLGPRARQSRRQVIMRMYSVGGLYTSVRVALMS